MAGTAAAASGVLTVRRTISEPARASSAPRMRTSKRPMLKPARSAPVNTGAISGTASAKVGAAVRSSLTMPWISLASAGMRICGLMRQVRGTMTSSGGGSTRTADSSTMRSEIGSVPVASMSKNTTGRDRDRQNCSKRGPRAVVVKRSVESGAPAAGSDSASGGVGSAMRRGLYRNDGG